MDAPQPCMTPSEFYDKITEDNFTEFSNLLNEFYLKIEHDSLNKLILISYNIKLLDNIRYESKITIDKLYQISSAFKAYQNIHQIYKAIIKIIEDGKFDIKQNSKTISLVIKITDILSKTIDVEITLIDINDSKKDDFLCVLGNELVKIRNQKDELDIIKKEQDEFKKEIEELKKMIQ